MSRTYRRKNHPDKNWFIKHSVDWGKRTDKEAEAKFHSENCWYESMPHWFRNMVNRQRRARDKQELWKEINNDDCVGNYDPWNCKTSRAWDYF